MNLLNLPKIELHCHLDGSLRVETAIELAKKGEGNVSPNPMVGAVIVKDGKVIGQGYHEKCGEGHAEVNAFKSLKEDPSEATMYVTLEPCSMCAGALIQARLKKVYIGTMDKKTGACGSVLNLLNYEFNHKVDVETGILQQECEGILKDFFKELRDSKGKN